MGICHCLTVLHTERRNPLRDVYQRIQRLLKILDLVVVQIQLDQVREGFHHLGVQTLDVVLS